MTILNNMKESMLGPVTEEQKQKLVDKEKEERKLQGANQAHVEVTADGKGDLSDITWSDGSVKSLDYMRVFGRHTKIVSKKGETDDEEDDKIIEVHRVLESTRTSTRSSVTTSARSSGRSSIVSFGADANIHLPVLFFHGICSSGLKVEKSGLAPKYEGQRAWLKKSFLTAGMVIKSDIHFKRNTHEDSDHEDAEPHDDEDDEEKHEDEMGPADAAEMEKLEHLTKGEEEFNIKSAWIYHMALDKNGVDELPGNRVRPYPGIKGCDYLMRHPKSLTVFEDAIRTLEVDLGYERGKDVDGAPYDWRIPPGHLEARDGYFTKTMERIERMFKENDCIPIILACHSMGSKVVHYLLNFCLQKKGQDWVDRHIHTYMPIGAPLSGAHSPIRVGVTGTDMLGPFEGTAFSKEEAIFMYRSWGSGPWLLPRKVPEGVFPPCMVRREGELGIKIMESDLGPLFVNRVKPPRKLRLTVAYRDTIIASTGFVHLEKKENSETSLILKMEEEFFLAVPDLKDGDDIGSLVFYLEEPAGYMYQTKKNSLHHHLKNATKVGRVAKKKVTQFRRKLSKRVLAPYKVAVCKTQHLKASSFKENPSSTSDPLRSFNTVVPLTACHGNASAKAIRYLQDNKKDQKEEGNGNSVPENNANSYFLKKRATCDLSIHLTYSPPKDFSGKSDYSGTPIGLTPEDAPPPPVVSINKENGKEEDVYDFWHAHDLFKADGFYEGVFDLTEKYYTQDPLVSMPPAPPPVKRVRAIYGINVPTQICFAYRKEPVVIVGDGMDDVRYTIDETAAWPHINEGDKTNKDKSHMCETIENYYMKHGEISEIEITPQSVPYVKERRRCSGDGSVPYWSLASCLDWRGTVPIVTVDELEGAHHPEIIYDKRFIALLKHYCTVDDPASLYEVETPEHEVAAC